MLSEYALSVHVWVYFQEMEDGVAYVIAQYGSIGGEEQRAIAEVMLQIQLQDQSFQITLGGMLCAGPVTVITHKWYSFAISVDYDQLCLLVLVC
jgi:hypothetical protein